MAGSNGLHPDVFDFLFGRINYERMSDIPYREDRFRLWTMSRLLEALGNPHDNYPIIHVAGTKGKGSTSSMLGSIMTAAGLRTGVYSSPHLHRLEERFCIDSTLCETGELVGLLEEIRLAVEQIDREVESPGSELTRPTFFEITTAAAMLYFSRQEVECAIFEVGLGGRLDATNVCSPVLTMITSISLDHTRQLGSTVEQIAGEKAGIVKQGVPLISGVTEAGPAEVIAEMAQSRQSTLFQLGDHFTFSEFDDSKSNSVETEPQRRKIIFRATTADKETQLGPFEVGLPGPHQSHNAALAIAGIDYLRNKSSQLPLFQTIENRAIEQGLSQVQSPGRVELVSQSPRIICDIAHNTASVRALLETLPLLESLPLLETGDREPVSRRVLLFATSRDKDASGMLRLLLPSFEHTILTRFESNPRSCTPQRLMKYVDKLRAESPDLSFSSVEVCDDPKTALRLMYDRLNAETMGCVTGSAFIVAELRESIIEHALASRNSSTAGATPA